MTEEIETPEEEAPETDAPDEAQQEETQEDGGEAQQETVRVENSIPLATFLEMKERAKEAEARAKELAEKQAQKPDFAAIFASPDLGEPPDAYENPDGRDEWRAKQSQAQYREFVNRNSYRYAIRTFGEDETNEALMAFAEASKSNPILKQAADSSDDPVGEIVDWNRQRKLVSTVTQSGGLEGYEKALREKWEAEMKAAKPQARKADQQTAKSEPAGDMPTDDFSGTGAAPKKAAFKERSLSEILGSN